MSGQTSSTRNKVVKKTPPKAGRGRPKGSPNKTTAAVKDMILQALDKKGGVDYLVEQAGENPTAFLSLLGKVLPLQVQGDPSNPIGISIIERRIIG